MRCAALRRVLTCEYSRKNRPIKTQQKYSVVIPLSFFSIIPIKKTEQNGGLGMKRQMFVFTSLAFAVAAFVGCSGEGTTPVRTYKVNPSSSAVSPGADAEAITTAKRLQAERDALAEKQGNKLPVLNSISDVRVDAGKSFSIVPLATDPEGEALKYYLQCPVELGGPKESDSPFFSVSVDTEMASQSATCAVIVQEQGKYLQKSELQQFKVTIRGAASSSPSTTSTMIKAVAPMLCENLDGWAKTICQIGGTVAGGLIK